MSAETDLHFRLFDKGDDDPARLPSWSARGCTQTLALLSHTEIRRTVNGELIDVSSPFHQKYTSTITCRDQASPAFDGVWVGTALWVDCLQRLSAPFAAGEQTLTLARKPVPHSVGVEDRTGKKLGLKNLQEKTVVLKNSPDQPGFITYQPQLLMRLTDFTLETDEWGMTVGWKMTLEEV